VLYIQSDSPIPGANIIVQGSDPLLGAVSGPDGSFDITGVQVGRHTLMISFIGYADKYLPEVFVTTGKNLYFDIKLEESLIQMDEILVVAQADKGEPLNEMATVSAKSFSVEETSRYAATFDDPARAALSFAGVRGGGDDLLNEIVIRGNSPRGMLWRIEGVEVPNPNHFAEVGTSGGGISMLSVNMLGNSDFYTGAFPAEYGNALSGVFDVNLRKGNNSEREYAFQAGLLGVESALEGPFKKGSNSSYLVNFRYSTLALLEDLGLSVLSDNEDIRFGDVSFKLHFPTRNAGTFSLWGFGGTSRSEYKSDTSEQEYFNDIWFQRTGATGLNHIFFVNNDGYISTTVSLGLASSAYHYDSVGVLQLGEEHHNEYNIRTSVLYNQKLGARNTLRTGLIFTHSWFDLFSDYYYRSEKEFIRELDQGGSSNMGQGYVQWQHRFNERLKFNAGIHSTYLTLNKDYSIEPRAGAEWIFAPNQRFTAGLGIHSRAEAPSVYRAQYTTEEGRVIFPNKDLRLTKSIHYVLGYRNKLSKALDLRTEVYYQDLYDVPIRPKFITDPFDQTFSSLNAYGGFTTDTLVNNGSGANYGVEITLEKYLTNSYYFLFTSSLFESKYVPADGNTYDTRFNGNFILNFTGGKEFKVGKMGNNVIALNSRVIWSGGNRVTPIDLEKSNEKGKAVYLWDQRFSQRLDDYIRLDLGLSYRKNKLKYSSVVALNIQNVTGRENAYSIYYHKESGDIRTATQMGMFPNLSYRIEF
jgi:hypothetical protein